MLRNHRGNDPDVNLLLVRLVFTTFSFCFFFSRALAAQGQPSAQDILQRFYQASGGSAWQHYEECDSEGTATVAAKTGSLRYVEDLHSGANVSHAEIQTLDGKQTDGNGPLQSWHQDADGDIQLSDPDSPG